MNTQQHHHEAQLATPIDPQYPPTTGMPTPAHQKPRFLPRWLAILLLTAIVAFAFFSFLITSITDTKKEGMPMAKTSPTATPTPDLKAITWHWKTYTELQWGISFKYPLTIDDSHKNATGAELPNIRIALPIETKDIGEKNIFLFYIKEQTLKDLPKNEAGKKIPVGNFEAFMTTPTKNRTDVTIYTDTGTYVLRVMYSTEENKKKALEILYQFLSTITFISNDTIQAAKKSLAFSLDIPIDSIKTELKEMVWKDTCLGLAPQTNCGVKVDIPGYEVKFSALGKSYFYHSGGEYFRYAGPGESPTR